MRWCSEIELLSASKTDAPTKECRWPEIIGKSYFLFVFPNDMAEEHTAEVAVDIRQWSWDSEAFYDTDQRV